MKKILTVLWCALFCIGVADAAVRDETSVNRAATAGATTVSRTATTPTTSNRATTARTATNSVTRDVSARTAGNESTVSRAAATPRTARSATTTSTARTAVQPASVRSNGAAARSAMAQKTTSTARAATTNTASKTFGTGYNSCRDVYFTCMDQFCAKANDTYRRCICSSKLEDIKSKERALGQTANQLQDFKDLNIDAINKTSGEVKAMLSASAGETAANKKDTSSSAQQLAGISAVLNKTKSESLSTQGKLDIAGDINAIWSTTDLAAGADLANLTGEKLYNAVHSQCAEMARETCESTSTLNMVVSAYGMYVENDCSNLSNALSKKITEAQGAIRETEREVGLARLDNYNAHNSTSINDCIAQVRKDITSDAACGTDYVHCLDITGKYLNHDSGEPIYTSSFYQLELQTSLTGDVLSNQTNRMLVNELNRKKEYAARGLDTCRDLSDEVWEEFMRQAIAEIYQGQQERIRQVKTECIDVVNNCYDTQSKSLKDFSNVKEQLLLGSRMELSEQMCKEKLDACSNLYGGGDVGLAELLDTMWNITDQKIAQNCRAALEEYAKDICIVPSSDIVHGYPYACRVYAPGEQRYATIKMCNEVFTSPQTPVYNEGGSSGGNDGGDGPGAGSGYSCPTYKKYTSCKANHYMTVAGVFNNVPVDGNACTKCPDDCICTGGTADKNCTGEVIDDEGCGEDYIGSLYQKLVRYALQTCVRPTQANEVIPTTVLADVNIVMDSIRVTMGKELSAECERRGGIWVDTPCLDKESCVPCTSATASNCKLLQSFYTETSSNLKWGYCAPLPEE